MRPLFMNFLFLTPDSRLPIRESRFVSLDSRVLIRES